MSAEAETLLLPGAVGYRQPGTRSLLLTRPRRYQDRSRCQPKTGQGTHSRTMRSLATTMTPRRSLGLLRQMLREGFQELQTEGATSA